MTDEAETIKPAMVIRYRWNPASQAVEFTTHLHLDWHFPEGDREWLRVFGTLYPVYGIFTKYTLTGSLLFAAARRPSGVVPYRWLARVHKVFGSQITGMVSFCELAHGPQAWRTADLTEHLPRRPPAHYSYHPSETAPSI